MFEDTARNLADDVRGAQRRATYDFNVAQAALARRAQADYGRWCLTALLVAHVSILGLAAFGAGDNPIAAWPAPVVGLTLTLLAGLTSWANWALSAVVYAHWADDRLLDPADTSEVAPPRAKKLAADIAWLLAVAFAGAAIVAVPVAVWMLAGG